MPFKLMLTCIVKGEPRAHNEILHRRRHEDLGPFRQGPDPRADDDRETSDLAIDVLYLAMTAMRSTRRSLRAVRIE